MADETTNLNAPTTPAVTVEPSSTADTFLDLDKPAEQEAAHVDVEAPITPQTEEKKTDDQAPTSNPALNCPACQGSGLKDESTLCFNCHGLGRVE